ncbi:MAG TPA: hypothetical protein VL337_01060 [Acidimicrobiales bacterium]|jgi:hypothetical protein|nr:hypothetical protein [Acidimicrobiales bacterium]
MALLPVAPFVLASPAHAAGPGRCYPPPCALGATESAPVAEAATLGGGPVVVTGSPEAAASHGSPVPDVLIGLSAVVGSLTVVGLRRRQHLARRATAQAERGRARPAPVRQGNERETERVALR